MFHVHPPSCRNCTCEMQVEEFLWRLTKHSFQGSPLCKWEHVSQHPLLVTCYLHFACNKLWMWTQCCVLRRLKTYLRTTIGQERLTGLALIHLHYSMDLDLDEIVNIFARQHPRKMLLMDILCTPQWLTFKLKCACIIIIITLLDKFACLLCHWNSPPLLLKTSPECLRIDIRASRSQFFHGGIPPRPPYFINHPF